MKIKEYKEITFENLIFALKRYVGDTKTLNVFINMLNENKDEFPQLVNIFIHDMSVFMSHWFQLVEETKFCSKSVKSTILNIDFVKQHYIKDFDRFSVYCYDVIDGKKNKFTNRLLTTDIFNHLNYIIKMLVQNQRRTVGMDQKKTEEIHLSNRYGVNNKLVRSYDNPDKWYLVFGRNREADYCRIGLHEGERDWSKKDYSFIDPSGGPFISVGSKIKDMTVYKISEEKVNDKFRYTIFMK